MLPALALLTLPLAFVAGSPINNHWSDPEAIPTAPRTVVNGVTFWGPAIGGVEALETSQCHTAIIYSTPFSFFVDGVTKTDYGFTSTLTQCHDCGGCHLGIDRYYGSISGDAWLSLHPPRTCWDTTTTVTAETTVTVDACAPSTTALPPLMISECGTVFLHPSEGAASTLYQRTAYATTWLNCSECPVVADWPFQDSSVVRRATSTVPTKTIKIAMCVHTAGVAARAENAVTPTPPPFVLPTRTSPHTITTNEGCTSTLSKGTPFIFGPAKTEYTSTSTVTAYHSCGTCSDLDVININGIGPQVVFTTTTTLDAVATATKDACLKPTANVLKRDEPCITTLVHAEPFTHGPVETIWTATHIVTEFIECDGCALKTKNPKGLGPEAFFTTTETATGARTVTTFECEN